MMLLFNGTVLSTTNIVVSLVHMHAHCVAALELSACSIAIALLVIVHRL